MVRDSRDSDPGDRLSPHLASFPFSFRVSGYGHHLQLAASCPAEKAIWMSAINDSLSVKPTWSNEPLSSLQTDVKIPPIITTAVEPEAPSGLPTIQSMSELEKQSEARLESSPHKTKYPRTISRADGIALRSEHLSQGTLSALSRRSSTASVKAIFAATLELTRVARPSAQYRAQVEHGLHDVFSEACMTSRGQAQMRGEELFQLRVPGARRPGSAMSRSNSGLSLASAMGLAAAKRKYDSVVVSRRNRSVDLDVMPPLPPLPPAASAHVVPASESGVAAPAGPGLMDRAKSLAVRRHRKQPASIAPAINTAIAQFSARDGSPGDGAIVQSPEALTLDSPPVVSRCSSVSSNLPSPVDATSLPIPVPGSARGGTGTVRPSSVSPVRGGLGGGKPTRSRSMVDNVRSFFQPPRQESPSASCSSDSGRASPVPPLGPGADAPAAADYSSSIVQWLRRTSLRRRTSGSSTPSSTEDGGVVPVPVPAAGPPRSRSSVDGFSPGGAVFLDPAPSPDARRRGLDGGSPKRHRSLFAPSTRSSFELRDDGEGALLRTESPTPDLAGSSSSASASPFPYPGPLPSPAPSLTARKSLRNILLFQRSNAFTPVGAHA